MEFKFERKERKKEKRKKKMLLEIDGENGENGEKSLVEEFKRRLTIVLLERKKKFLWGMIR